MRRFIIPATGICILLIFFILPFGLFERNILDIHDFEVKINQYENSVIIRYDLNPNGVFNYEIINYYEETLSFRLLKWGRVANYTLCFLEYKAPSSHRWRHFMVKLSGKL